ncbi:LOW QUALITY PROTEIN: melanoma-associated antigen 10-like [Acomys russatus]|uniref:LOW QUALITY PROTEIN: melanoma-associated antigen 10-like n=1 Tax=Acomys russatus TaxID=60746 RepID=UPI0021E27F50|nr:LOW QUALITY PROTEIN: melanoma-associated antigen 10-like [Acomys russatus]
MNDPQDTQYSNLPDSPQAQWELDSARATMAAAREEEVTVSEEMYSGGTPSSPQSPQRASPPPMEVEMASMEQVQEMGNPLSMLHNALHIKAYDLVHFLVSKYEMKALTSKGEMLEAIGREYEDYYPLIFSKASECLKLVFGIDMIEVDPVVHIYVLVIALGLTYDGMLTPVEGMPKTGLLIVVLGIIFMQGNRVREEVIWNTLKNIGLPNESGPYLCEDPRKLIFEDFVREGYLHYRRVPDSDPPSYEFLWGLRAHIETTKMKVLKFFSSITRTDPREYPEKYAEALRDEIERAQAWIAGRMTSGSDPHTFSCTGSSQPTSGQAESVILGPYHHLRAGGRCCEPL